MTQIAAAVSEGIVAATETGLAADYATKQHTIDSKQYLIEQCQADLSIINGANATLNRFADVGGDIPSLANHISLFTQVWYDVASDANEIAQWVTDGEAAVVGYITL